MHTLKPNHKRAQHAMLLIWIILVLEVISILGDFSEYNLLQSALKEGYLSDEAASANDSNQRIIAIVYIITYIVSITTFILWFRRAYYNLHQKFNHLLYHENQAAWGWFIPIINLARPYQIMRELYEETNHYLTTKLDNYSQKKTMLTIGCWWALWIASNVFSRISYQLTRTASSIDDFIKSDKFSITEHAIGIVLALITVKVIHNYSQMENLMYDIDDTIVAATQESIVEDVDGVDEHTSEKEEG